MNNLVKAHFCHHCFLQPSNPMTVNVIGAGGTGSQMLTALARINHSLVALGHAGLSVTAWDADVVTHANEGRQLFSASEVGLNKAVVLVNRINRFFGFDWKAAPTMYNKKTSELKNERALSNITISCVDTVAARFEIAAILGGVTELHRYERNHPYYWMDFGNSKHTGQVLLSTVGRLSQPISKKFETVDYLPFVTDEFADLLAQSEQRDDTPSCSLAEALSKQDLFINSSLANIGASLLWQLFTEGILLNRGFFLNLKEYRTVPIKVGD
jgi:PRTRC genetic system ThiF family protein